MAETTWPQGVQLLSNKVVKGKETISTLNDRVKRKKGEREREFDKEDI